jgi:hypothetical protein
LRGTQFRQWATKRLNEYIRKGFTMDDERLKNMGGGGYWKELLQRIRDIRASEKVFYRQVLEIYATSIDYDPKADVSIDFFKKVQNKIHYAVHGQTAAEVIFSRVDAEKEFMGLMTFVRQTPLFKRHNDCKKLFRRKRIASIGTNRFGIFGFCRTPSRTRASYDNERLGRTFRSYFDNERRKTYCKELELSATKKQLKKQLPSIKNINKKRLAKRKKTI